MIASGIFFSYIPDGIYWRRWSISRRSCQSLEFWSALGVVEYTGNVATLSFLSKDAGGLDLKVESALRVVEYSTEDNETPLLLGQDAEDFRDHCFGYRRGQKMPEILRNPQVESLLNQIPIISQQQPVTLQPWETLMKQWETPKRSQPCQPAFGPTSDQELTENISVLGTKGT